MVAQTFYLCLSCVLIIIPGIKAEDKSNLTYSCPGNETQIGNLANAGNIGDVCGDGYEFLFDAAARPLTSGSAKLYFSSDDEYDDGDIEVLSDYFGAYYSMKIDVHRYTTVTIPADLPCGSGYLVAVVREGTNIVEQKAERIINTCDTSGVDIEVEVVPEANETIPLQAGQSLNGQLGGSIGVKLVNRGSKLPNTTKEGAHVLAVYLQRGHMYHTHMSSYGCYVPNVTVFDAVLNFTTFTRGIQIGEEFTIDPNWVNEIMVSFDDDQPTICGDATLVIMFDPFYMYDSNPCNNFKTYKVNINCHGVPHTQKCFIFANAMVRGHTAHVTYSDPSYAKAYEFSSSSGDYWSPVSNYDGDRRGIMGYARIRILLKILKSLNQDSKRGLCKMADRIDQEIEDELRNGSVNTTEVPTTETLTTEIPTTDDPQAVAARNKIESVENQLSSNNLSDWTSFQNAINEINNLADGVHGDMLLKYKLRGKALGLNLTYHHNYYKMMYGSYLPANTSRIIISHVMRGLAEALVQINKRGFSMYDKDMYLGPLVMYFAAFDTITNLIPVPEPLSSMLPRIKMQIMSFIRQFKSTSSKSESGCPYMFNDLESAPPIGRFLLHLSESSREDSEEQPDTSDLLERCHRRLVATYFRYGGKSLIAKDIFRQMISEAKSKGKDVSNIPDGCRKNPFMTANLYQLHWKKDDGRIMVGVQSPWTVGKMHWRVAAICKCDQCHGGYNNWYGSTTYSYGSTYGYNMNGTNYASYNSQPPTSYSYNHPPPSSVP